MMKRDPTELKPCTHMQLLVSAWTDGQLNGLLRQFTEWHIRHCPRCSSAVSVLQTLRGRLRRLPPHSEAPLSLGRREFLEEAWKRADEGAPLSGADPP